MRNKISFEGFLSKVFAWLCIQIARPEVRVSLSFLFVAVCVGASRDVAAQSLNNAKLFFDFFSTVGPSSNGKYLDDGTMII